MMSVPTDCPSREKGGYTGDLLIYAKTALKNEKLTPFLKSWLNSVRLDQAGDGVVMIVSPYMKLYENLMKDVSARYGEDTISGVADGAMPLSGSPMKCIRSQETDWY